MHSLITQLLKEEDNPRPEDVECLCKLLSTVGAQLDGTSKSELKLAMKVCGVGQVGHEGVWCGCGCGGGVGGLPAQVRHPDLGSLLVL